jgi:hypothetical protein
MHNFASVLALKCTVDELHSAIPHSLYSESFPFVPCNELPLAGQRNCLRGLWASTWVLLATP